MSSANKVDGIIKALTGLEDDIDSLNTKVADIKKSLNSTAQKEIDKLMAKTNEISTKEAEAMIADAKQKAQAQADQILEKGEGNLSEIKSNIDAKFDEAVDHVVSTVLKA